MKREFLENFKVGDQALPKEIIDAIMAENGRDIEAAKKPFADYDAIKEQLETARNGLKAFEGVDVSKLNERITELTGQLSAKDDEWQKKLADKEFEGTVKDAITAAKGKNHKAITALLDVDALRASKNQAADLKTALDNLQKENGYLFGDDQVPPPYSAGTGGSGAGAYSAEDSLRAAMGLPAAKK